MYFFINFEQTNFLTLGCLRLNILEQDYKLAALQINSGLEALTQEKTTKTMRRSLPYGETFFERRDYWNTPYKFNAKELDAETGMYYYGARYYTPEVSIWLSVDPLADKYPSMSAFMYCAGNPVVLVDINGMEWYEVENSETKETEIKWTNFKSQDEMDENGVEGKFLGEAVVVFNGSEDEKLGKDGKLTGEGANPAEVIIYGINGEDDINTYDGLTMTSDPEKYSPIEEGDYNAFYQDMATSPYGSKGGTLSYRISKVDGSLVLSTKDKSPNIDKNSENYGKPIKTGIFFHRTNNNGYAARSSSGCLIVDGRQWKDVEKQLGKSKNIFIRVTR
jgi:RHS repeat-associated protein